MAEQGTEVNKNSTSYTSVVSPQQKKKKKKEKTNKERVWGQTTRKHAYIILTPLNSIFVHFFLLFIHLFFLICPSKQRCPGGRPFG